MSSIEAKETVYHGTTFRSRLEARWAIVFDTLDVEWVYEPQEYELGLKRTWGEEDKEELREALSLAWDHEERAEQKREAVRVVIFLMQSAWSQKNRRTCRISCIRKPAQGRSAPTRGYWLWRRWARQKQSGQHDFIFVETT